MKLHKTFGMLGLLVGAMISNSASAETFDYSMPVSAEVTGRCNVTATPMTFIVTNPGANTNVDSSATVQVQCTSLSIFVVSIDNGQNALGTQRRMVSNAGSGFLEYEIYKNAGRSQRWGQGAFSGQFAITLGGTVNFTAYGRVPTVSSFDPAGTYSDTVVVTISF